MGTAAAGGLILTEGYTAGTAADLVTGITSCATGSGTTQGPAVYYTLSIDAATFAAMETAGATTYTITYTLTAGCILCAAVTDQCYWYPYPLRGSPGGRGV